jgi:hypothetical protein
VNLPTADGVWAGHIDGNAMDLTLVQNGRAVAGVGTLEGTAVGTVQLKVNAIADGTDISGTMSAPTFSFQFQGTMTGGGIVATLNGAGFKAEAVRLYRER